MAVFSRRSLIAGACALGAGAAFFFAQGRGKGAEAAAELYATPLTPPKEPMQIYHLCHSLVGRDMPAMLAQLADHSYDLQIGWGTSLNQHLGAPEAVNGFEATRPAQKALASGSYDALIATEMVEIADAIKYHDSARALGKWAEAAQSANPAARVYLYETWHHTDDPKGWLARIDTDLNAAWKGQILYPALAKGHAIHLIPAGQVMSAVARAVEAQGGLPGFADRSALFSKTPQGAQDTIHLSDVGAYLVALTHYAVLYHRSPVGLPGKLMRADGTPADAPSPQAAALMQETVWQVVTRHDETGVRP